MLHVSDPVTHKSMIFDKIHPDISMNVMGSIKEIVLKTMLNDLLVIPMLGDDSYCDNVSYGISCRTPINLFPDLHCYQNSAARCVS